MKRVHDHGRLLKARGNCGDPADRARLRGVRMHDVRAVLTNDLAEVADRREIVTRRDLALQVRNEQRLDTMRKLGASATVNAGAADAVADAIRGAGRGYDVVIDASGSAPARQLAFDFCRPGGQVVLLGMGTQRSEVNFVTSIRKEHRVVMSFAYTPVDFRRSLDLLTAGEIDLTPWTIRMPLERGQEALERMSHDPGVSLKMMLEVAGR